MVVVVVARLMFCSLGRGESRAVLAFLVCRNQLQPDVLALPGVDVALAGNSIGAQQDMTGRGSSINAAIRTAPIVFPGDKVGPWIENNEMLANGALLGLPTSYIP